VQLGLCVNLHGRRRPWRQLLVSLALASSTSARLLWQSGRSAPGTRPPTGEPHPAAEHYALELELERAGDDVDAIERVLEQAQAELDTILRLRRARQTLAPDDEQARRVRLLLLGKGVVSAHRIERPFAQGRRRGASVGFSAGGLLAAALRTGLATSTASGSP
jgi:hypothetical protein